MFKKLFVVATHGVGDILMTLRAINVIKENYFIVILTSTDLEKDVCKHFLQSQNIKYIVLNSFSGNKLLKFFKLIFILRKENFDFSISQYGVSSFQYSFLCFCSSIKYRIGWKGYFSFLNSHNLSYSTRHKVIDTFDLFRSLEYFPSNINDDVIKTSPIERSRVIVFGVSSFENEQHKRWPLGNFVELAKLIIANHDYQIVLVGSKEDYAYCQKIVDLTNSLNIVNYSGKFSIIDSIKLIENCYLAVTNCNAISHIAGTLGLYVVGLYGPTNPYLTGPFTSRLRIIQSSLPCSPCYSSKFTSGCGNPICMNSISVDRVYNEVRFLLDKK